MKKLNVFDTYKNMKDSEKYGFVTEEMLEKLDAMLDEYDVAHAFSLCRDEDIEADGTCSVTVMYNSEDNTKFVLVYALFCMKYRNVEADLIEKALEKHVNAA